jgi:hypothetical protein
LDRTLEIEVIVLGKFFAKVICLLEELYAEGFDHNSSFSPILKAQSRSSLLLPKEAVKLQTSTTSLAVPETVTVRFCPFSGGSGEIMIELTYTMSSSEPIIV